MQNKSFNISLGSYPRQTVIEAMKCALNGNLPTDDFINEIGFDHVQICPQNHGQMTHQLAEEIKNKFQWVQFRLHANVQVMGDRIISHFSDYMTKPDYWSALASISRTLGANGYTAHAGLRAEANLSDVIEYSRRAEDLFGCPVGIEGHYPAKGNPYLISSWKEYQALFESGAKYALDLSHLNILAEFFGRYEKTLVRDMLSSPNCIEVHVSGNNGKSDAHSRLISEPIWWQDMDAIHDASVIFVESHYKS